MTSEEIIERLLDEKKITAKEALIILKDLAKIGLREVGMRIFPDQIKPVKPDCSSDVIVMYGICTNPYTYDSTNTNTTTKTTDIDIS